MVPQILGAQVSVGWLHIVLIPQTVEGCLCYVHSPGRDMFRVVGDVCDCRKFLLIFLAFLWGLMSSYPYKLSSAVKALSPRLPSCLHHVGERHVVGPDVVLPLAQPQHPTQHPPRVDANPHVELDVCCIHHRPGDVGRLTQTFAQTL